MAREDVQYKVKAAVLVTLIKKMLFFMCAYLFIYSYRFSFALLVEHWIS